jgi:DNA-binding NtrC family response regulator
MDAIKVLVIDDEEELVDTLVERLELRGLAAKGATTGREALECLNAGPFDVVLLDVKMPEVSGLYVLKEIKNQWPELPVIMLTGHGSVQDAKDGMDWGAYDYLMKPLDIETLVPILGKAAGRKTD